MTMSSARIAGLSAIALTFLGPFCLLYVPEQTLVVGDLSATAALQLAQAGLVRLGVVGELGIVAVEIIMSVALWDMFARAQPRGAALVGASRLAMTLGQAAVAVLSLGALLSFEQGLVEAGGGLLAAKTAGALVWKALFGLHCGVLAAVMMRDGSIPRILSGLMGITALAYVLLAVGSMVAPEQQAVWSSAPVTLALMGELPFFLWLLAGRYHRSYAAYAAA
jgi:hypothetical protein